MGMGAMGLGQSIRLRRRHVRADPSSGLSGNDLLGLQISGKSRACAFKEKGRSNMLIWGLGSSLFANVVGVLWHCLFRSDNRGLVRSAGDDRRDLSAAAGETGAESTAG